MTADVTIEVPRGSFVKPRADGARDFVSPLPCPFNYGSVAGTTGGDGDPLDAVVLGAALPAGAVVRVPVRATVRFVDAGEIDDKLICADRPLGRLDRFLVVGFFRAYAVAKGVLNALRGRPRPTRFVGLTGAADLTTATRTL